MESAESSAQALYDADGSRQGAEEDHDGDRTRTVGLYLGHRDQGRSGLQATNGGMKGTERTKAKTFQIRKKQKQKQKQINNVIQIEDRVSRSRSKHEGESSASLCDRLSRTREVSQRQLPTDHDYAVPTREYQLDQSSPLPATAAADPVLERTNAKTTPTIRRC